MDSFDEFLMWTFFSRPLTAMHERKFNLDPQQPFFLL